MRIFYIVPRLSAPSAAVRISAEHVRTLSEAGHEAYIYAADPDWLKAAQTGIEVPYWTGTVPLTADDLLVRGEMATLGMLQNVANIGARQLIHVQNHFTAHNSLQYVERFSDLNVAGVFSASETVAAFLSRHYGLVDNPVVPCAIEPATEPAVKRPLSVAWAPGSRSLEANAIESIVNGRCADLGSIEWIELDKLPYPEFLSRLSRAAIFLSLQRLDGIGQSALAAMASGCAVVGFTGQGGDEYATPENGIWCPEDDVFAAAAALEQALRQHVAKDPALETMVNNGRRTAAGYSPARRDAALLTLFARLEASGSR